MSNDLLKLQEEVKLLQEEINGLTSANRRYVQTLNDAWNIMFIRQGSETTKLFEIQLLLRDLLLSEKNGNHDTSSIPHHSV